MTIGEVARRTGLRASAIRYYERAGLLPKPGRVAGQRRYDAGVLDRIAVLAWAKACGFTLAEVRVFFNGQDTHSIKWQRLAAKKIAELEAAVERIQEMKKLLERGCRCETIAECGRRLRGLPLNRDFLARLQHSPER